MRVKVGDKVKIVNINTEYWNEDVDVESYLNKIGVVGSREPDTDYFILVRFKEDNLKSIYFYENELEVINTEELSSAEFLMSTVTRANAFTPKFIEALADVVWKAERAQKLEEEIDSEIGNEREMNKIIGGLRSENILLREALKSACYSLGADIEDYLSEV